MKKNKVKQFNNTPNKNFTYNNKIYWHNRTCAVTVNVICLYNNEFYYLIGKRGNTDIDAYKHNIIGGYIDWDENLKEASVRELYEESGLNIDSIKSKNVLVNNLDQPIYVYSDVNTNNQNIILVTEFIFKSKKLPKLTIDNCEEDETTDVYWVKLDDVKLIDDWAFKHKEMSDMIISNIKYKYNSLN